jgi:uncharacterized protein YndB with AHSA1/START domain
MKIWLIICILVLLAIALVVLVGYLLPAEHVATRSMRLKQKPTEVFAAVTDFAATPGWRSGIKSVELLTDRDGGRQYRETTAHGVITYRVVEWAAPSHLVTVIADDRLPFGGSWTWEMAAEADGTQIRITERGTVKNPIFRFLARFVFGYTGTMETYLRDLGRKFGEKVTITP